MAERDLGAGGRPAAKLVPHGPAGKAVRTQVPSRPDAIEARMRETLKARTLDIKTNALGARAARGLDERPRREGR
jgi:antitoxin (DNA-binding transcriptional repressor) of toxin-antitoxin stability system